MVAVTVLLLFEVRPQSDPSIIQHVQMAVEILEAMDESMVAKKFAEIVRHFLNSASRLGVPRSAPSNSDRTSLASIFAADHSLVSQMNCYEVWATECRTLGANY